MNIEARIENQAAETQQEGASQSEYQGYETEQPVAFLSDAPSTNVCSQPGISIPPANFELDDEFRYRYRTGITCRALHCIGQCFAA